MNVELFWASQDGEGVQMNLSGGGVVATSDDKADAQQLLEWLATDGQEDFVGGNHEYPVNPDVEARRGRRGVRPVQADADRRRGLRPAATPRRSTCWRKSATSDRTATPGPDADRSGRLARGRCCWSPRSSRHRSSPSSSTGCGPPGSVSLPSDLGEMVVTTLLLMAAVGVGTLVVGGGLAWLVTVGRFPLRDLFSWMLVLPLAMPAYILGFVFLSTFDEAGPVQRALRDLLGDGALAAAGAHAAGRGAGHDDDAVPLRLPDGAGRLHRAVADDVRRRAVARRLPDPGAVRRRAAAGPAVAGRRAGAGDDGGAHRLRDRAVLRRRDRLGRASTSSGRAPTTSTSASQLSVLVLLFAVAVLGGRAAAAGARPLHPARRTRAAGWSRCRSPGCAAGRPPLACLLALGVGFLLPVVRLAGWAVGEARRNPDELVDPRFAEYLANSLTVALGDRAGLRRGLDARRARAADDRRPAAAGGRPGHHVRLRRAGGGRRHRRAARLRRPRRAGRGRSGSRAAPACWSPGRSPGSSTPTSSGSSPRRTKPSTPA